MVVRNKTAFVKAFLAEFIEARLLDGRLSTDRYHALKRQVVSDARHLSRELFLADARGMRYGGLHFKLRYLREPDEEEFPFIQVVPPTTSRRRIQCFVGHRFASGVEKSLRYNLTHLLEPYRIRLRWSGYDLSAADLFTDVVDLIKRSDMCIFDNRGTLNRPNVYIEVGVAHVLRKPMIVCEYVGKDQKRLGLETGSVPSDLRALLTGQIPQLRRLVPATLFQASQFPGTPQAVVAAA